MRNIILISTVLFLIGCEKNIIGDFESQEITYSSEVVTNKKGTAYSYKSRAWSHKIHDLGAHWMYHWGNTPREEIPENVEYLPMFWGKNSVTDAEIDRIKALKNEGKVNYVLAFNEPDGAKQANMSVDEAIALWPKLEEIGLPLVSPSVVGTGPNNAWLIEFMQKVEEQGLRVDYIGFHSYGGLNVLSFINKLKRTYQAFNRPIWITEFAVADWKATSAENNRYSEEDVLAFMSEVLPALDEIEWVYKYTWFDGHGRPQLSSSALFDDDDNLTPLGELYAQHHPNEIIGPGMDTEYIDPEEEGELIINGGFETNSIEPWAGFKNDVVSEATTEPHSGKYSGRIKNGDGSFVYILDIESSKTYTLKFYSKWSQNVTDTFTTIIKNDTGGSGKGKLWTLAPMPKSTDWSENTFEFTVPDGVDKLKFVFYKGKGYPPFFLDDVSVKEKN